MTLDISDEDLLRTDYSSISLFRTCPQAWFYRYERGLDRPREGNVPARDFGSWWHALRAAHALQRGRDHGSLLRLPRRVRIENIRFAPDLVTPGEVLDVALGWWTRLAPTLQEEWLAYLGTDLPTRLRYLDEEWRERYAEEIARERPLLVEQWWDRTVNGVKVGGYVDEVVLDTRREVVVVRDNKAVGDLGTQTALDDMMDSQLQLYAWGIAPLVAEVGKVRAVAYDRVAAPAPRSPVLTQSGALSKTVTRYDLRTYLEWVAAGQEYPGRKKDGSDAGIYQAEEAVLERLRAPVTVSRWFQRTMVPINVNIIRAHLTAALDSAAEQDRTAEQGRERGFAARNLGRACRWCDYRDLCRAELLGGPGGEYEPAEYGLVQVSRRR